MRQRRLVEAQHSVPPKPKVDKTALPSRIHELLRSLTTPATVKAISILLDTDPIAVADALRHMRNRGEVEAAPKRPGTKKPLGYWIETQ